MIMISHKLMMSALVMRNVAAFSPILPRCAATSRFAVRSFAAPGVEVSPSDQIKQAMASDKTTVLDVRGADEILE
jgi:hypothetical protein